MATIRRQRDRCEIRECIGTERGPRQRALARFRGPLTPEILDTASARAQRPFDRAAVVARARRLGIPVSEERRSGEARRLLAHLRAGGSLDPLLAGLLKQALAAHAVADLPPHLSDVIDWVGQGEQERGRALRGLLRSAGRVLASRGPLREPPVEPFPRFSSGARHG